MPCSARTAPASRTLMKIVYGVVQPDAGEIAWEGQPVAIADPNAARAPRHRHGLPAFLAVRDADGGREHRPRPRQPPVHRRAERRDPPGVGAIRAGGRGRPPCPPPFGRRTPARRDPALPAATAEAADHGRADQRADAAGGGRAVRHAAPAGRGRLQRPLHQPQARGDPRALHRGDGAARRPGGGALRSADRDRASRWPR